MQTDIQRIAWLREHGWRVENEAIVFPDGQRVRWIEHDRGSRSAWLRIVDGVILWHGAEDETWDEFIAAQTQPKKPSPKLRSLFGDDDDD